MTLEFTKTQTKNIEVTDKGQKKHSTFFEGEFESKEGAPLELSIEALINLGNFSSVRIITKRKGDDRAKLIEELITDLKELKKGFLDSYNEIYE